MCRTGLESKDALEAFFSAGGVEGDVELALDGEVAVEHGLGDVSQGDSIEAGDTVMDKLLGDIAEESVHRASGEKIRNVCKQLPLSVLFSLRRRSSSLRA